MPVRYFYVDESYDDTKFCLSALAIWHRDWHSCFNMISDKRKQLRAQYGLLTRKEIHARDFVSGRGNVSVKGRTIGKWQRSQIFRQLLQFIPTLPNVELINVALPYAGTQDPQLKAWDRLINRIETNMRKWEYKDVEVRRFILKQIPNGGLSGHQRQLIEKYLSPEAFRAFIVSDEGREADITKAFRRKHVFNHIPSRFGAWAGGQPTKNIVSERIIEDPVFKASERSHFLQLADCVAFSLLKREVSPTPNILKYKIHDMFDEMLGGICVKEACRSDPLGIVRN